MSAADNPHTMETQNHHNNNQQPPVKTDTAADNPPPPPDRRRRRRRPPKDDNSSSNNNNNNDSSNNGNEYSHMSEAELISTIAKRENTIKTVGHKLSDNGAKLMAQLARIQQELERRRTIESSRCEKPTGSGSSNGNGLLHGPEQAVPSSQPAEQSAFAIRFLEKVKENGKSESESNTTDDLVGKATDGEITCESQSHNRKRKPTGEFMPNRRVKPELSSSKFSAWKPLGPCGEIEKYRSVNGLSRKDPSVCNLPLSKERKEDSLIENEDASQMVDSKASRIDETVVLVDEEEPELQEQIQEVEELPSSSKERKIYYPSRDDPESLEIFLSELNCLEPGEYLTSTIMNFYIRFLQESPTDRFQNDIYFFNTYFYSKLQEAVSFKKSEKEAFFTKFRRWWKGVNIFKKAYIFLPINEDNHWSLVIICFPYEEDESGPIILHLDSLRLHCSRSIFNNIKTLLKSEWVYLNEDNGVSDIPISERIWKQLPRRIDEKIVMVPRQTNDSDCGLFVLYYMERFIKDAPKRLKRGDLAMFCKNWFKPQEASSLRGKIKRILRRKFFEEPAEDSSIWQPVCLTANAKGAKAVHNVHDS